MAITTFAPQMIKEVAKKHPSIAKELNALLGTARSILSTVETRLKQNDCEGALDGLDTMESQVKDPFEAAMQRAGFNMHKDDAITFTDIDDDIEDLYEDFESDFEDQDLDFQEFKRKMEEKGYKTKDLVVLKGVDPELLAEFLQYSTGGNSDVIKSAARAGIGIVDTEKLLATKNALLQEIAELEKAVTTLKASVRSIIEEMKQYTFNPAVEDDVAELLEEAPTLSAAELEDAFASLVEESRIENLEQGIAPFVDVDPFQEDHLWFVSSVKDMTKQGLFKGVDKEGKEFAPEQTANVAQVITVVGRALDVDQGASEVSGFARSMPDWAEGAASGLDETLAEQDTSLSAVFDGKKPGDAAERLEVARLLSSAFSDVLPESDTDVLEEYGDIDGLSEEDRMAVARMVEAGIMSGTSAGAWNPEGEFNRAQFATVMDRLFASTNLGDDGAADEDSAATGHRAAGSASESNEEDVDAFFEQEEPE